MKMSGRCREDVGKKIIGRERALMKNLTHSIKYHIIFIGPKQAARLIKMNVLLLAKSELHQVMVF